MKAKIDEFDIKVTIRGSIFPIDDKNPNINVNNGLTMFFGDTDTNILLHDNVKCKNLMKFCWKGYEPRNNPYRNMEFLLNFEILKNNHKEKIFNELGLFPIKSKCKLPHQLKLSTKNVFSHLVNVSRAYT